MRGGGKAFRSIGSALLLAVALLLVPAGLYSVPTASASEVVHVDILKGSWERGIGIYSPNSVTIKAGDTVTWTNRDINLHTVTSGKPYDRDAATAFASKRITSNQEFSHKFTSTGTFDYFCLVHPIMAGRVIVEEGPPSILLAADKLGYLTGDTVTMRGTVSIIRSAPVQIEVVNPAGTSYLFDSVEVGSNGSFAYSFVASSAQGTGTYKVIVKYLGSSADTTLRIEENPTASRNAGPTVTAYSRQGGLITLLAIKNTLSLDVHKVSVTVTNSAMTSFAAPRGWYGEIDDSTAVFVTDDRPAEPGKRITFRVTTASAVQSLNWVLFDAAGNPVADGTTRISR